MGRTHGEMDTACGNPEPATALRPPPAASADGAPPRLEAESLFREYGAYVFRLLRRLGVREADVDDVCQEVFVAVHQQLPGFEGRSKVSTWLYAIATRRAASHRRRAHVRREQPWAQVPDGDGQAAHGHADGDPQRALERARARALLDELLDTLDDDKRQVFVLYEIEELPMREVIEIVGCPLQTGYSRLHAARKRLRDEAQRRGLCRA